MHTVVIFGAGATKACGGPMTSEILPGVFQAEQHIAREGYTDLLNDFLVDNFHLSPTAADRKPEDYPGLPLLLSLVDTAIDRKHAFGADWNPDRLVRVREALDYVIFALLEHHLRTTVENLYYRLFQLLYADPGGRVTTLSLNYDIIADNALIRLGEEKGDGAETFPNYGCEVATPFYRDRGRFGTLLKLHGSMNWLYCPNCHRMDLGISESGRRTVKVLEMLYWEDAEHRLEERYTCHGSPCSDCQTHVRPVLITPTHRKDYRNPHISQIWYLAERALRQADRAVFVGYSLPEDDVEVAYLFKRGLSHLKGPAITVVEYDPQKRPLRDSPVGSRYRTLFGDGLDWRTEGFGDWLGGAARQSFPGAAGG